MKITIDINTENSAFIMMMILLTVQKLTEYYKKLLSKFKRMMRAHAEILTVIVSALLK